MIRGDRASTSRNAASLRLTRRRPTDSALPEPAPNLTSTCGQALACDMRFATVQPDELRCVPLLAGARSPIPSGEWPRSAPCRRARPDALSPPPVEPEPPHVHNVSLSAIFAGLGAVPTSRQPRPEAQVLTRPSQGRASSPCPWGLWPSRLFGGTAAPEAGTSVGRLAPFHTVALALIAYMIRLRALANDGLTWLMGRVPEVGRPTRGPPKGESRRRGQRGLGSLGRPSGPRGLGTGLIPHERKPTAKC